MAEPTLEEIVKRLEAVEKRLAERSSPQAQRLAWLYSLPTTSNPELVEQVHANIAAAREAEREAARRGDDDEPHIVE